MKKKTNLIKLSSIPLTIAIPTFKRPELLKLSLYSAVNQSYSGNYEIIVVDNCNEDKFKKKVDIIINSFHKYKNIRLIRNKTNIGMFGNWNKCLRRAKGKYISILNDDDLLDYNFVENVIKDIDGSKMLIYDHKLITKDAKQRKLGGRLRSIIENLDLKKKKKIFLSDLIFRNPSNGSLGVVFKRSNAILIGGYKKNFYPCSDYNFNYKYITKYGGLKIKKKLCKYRILVNESLNKDCLIDFVRQDHDLRRKIYLKYFKKIKNIFFFLELISFLQACSQCARYIFLRKITLNDFKDLNFGDLNKFKFGLIRFISLSRIICIIIEINILLFWKILFFCFE